MYNSQWQIRMASEIKATEYGETKKNFGMEIVILDWIIEQWKEVLGPV